MVLRRRFVLAVTLVIVITVGACRPEGLSVLNLPEVDFQDPTPTPLPAPVPTRVLSICLGAEPRSLFIYGDQSSSARIIRQAIYDGPVDRVGYQSLPIILEELPSQENGLVVLHTVEVSPGERIVDARGNATRLGMGVVYRPAGCLNEDCWETYQNQGIVTLDQVEISYNLIDDLFWSDGSPVTAEDSLFSYQTAQLIYNSIIPNQLGFTSSYHLGEDQDLLWQGLPGYLGIYNYADFFFHPLPKDRWENFTREEFLTAPQSNLLPQGWGAYQIMEWIPGDHISLLPNPYYWDAAQESPGFDALVFRFVDGAEDALAAFRAGECQIIANEPGLFSYQAELLSWQSAGELSIYTAEGIAWEQISFGIDSLQGNTAALKDPALRHALAGCIDRESITRSRLSVGAVVDSYQYPVFSPSADNEEGMAYQPARSIQELIDLGWMDEDGDPETPRIARGAANVPNGTKLAFKLLAAVGEERTLTLEYIKEGLRSCGVGIEVVTLPAADLLAPGPDGPIFGRDYDLAYFSWRTGSYHPCKLYMSSEIPGIYPDYPKGWGGVNNPGFSDPDFDEACTTVLTTLPDSEQHIQSAARASEIFIDQLPVIPLFFQRDLVIAQPQISGLESGFGPQFWFVEAVE